jgi:hypothetical protein
MRQPNRGQDSSRQGLELISIKYSLNSESIIKSRPKTSKLFYFRSGSIVPEQALIASVAIFFINGRILCLKLTGYFLFAVIFWM